MSVRRRIRKSPKGDYEIRLTAEERSLLYSLPGQIVEALGAICDAMGTTAVFEDEPSEQLIDIPDALRRLFPVAYPRDAQSQATFASATVFDLVDKRREQLMTLASSAQATRLSDEELDVWLAAINDIRLVLGSSLNLTEESQPLDTDDPRLVEWMVYSHLSGLVDEIVTALTESLPPAIDGAGDDLPDDPWGEPPGGLRWDGTPKPPGGA